MSNPNQRSSVSTFLLFILFIVLLTLLCLLIFKYWGPLKQQSQQPDTLVTGRVDLKRFFPDAGLARGFRAIPLQGRTYNDYINKIEEYNLLGHNIVNIRNYFPPSYWMLPAVESFKLGFVGINDLSHMRNTCFFIALLQNFMNNDGIREHVQRNNGIWLSNTLRGIYQSQNPLHGIQRHGQGLFGNAFQLGQPEDPSMVLNHMFANHIQILGDEPLYYTNHTFICGSGCLTSDKTNLRDLDFVTSPVCHLPTTLPYMFHIQDYLYGIRQNNGTCSVCGCVNLFLAPFFSHAPSFLILRRGIDHHPKTPGRVLTYPFRMTETIRVRTIGDGEATYELTGFSELIYNSTSRQGYGHYIAYLRRNDGFHKVEHGDFRPQGEPLHRIKGLDYKNIDCVFYQRVV